MAIEVRALQVYIEAHGWFGVGLEPHGHRGVMALDVPREGLLEVRLAVKDGSPARELLSNGTSSRFAASFTVRPPAIDGTRCLGWPPIIDLVAG
ncbi:MAG: hypothetical protein ACT4P1_10655 [Sporichthyaceae bacterium]